MREFRFRAWGHQENDEYRMFYGVALSSWSVPYFEDIPVCDHKLMQYTGILDKNGKEVYEGDIIESNSGVWDNGEVMFRNGAFRVHAFLLCELTHPEIIGNIYEHPELRKDA